MQWMPSRGSHIRRHPAKTSIVTKYGGGKYQRGYSGEICMVEWLQATKEYMSKNTWLTTDLHFSHKGMIELCGRPQDFEKRIVRHWDRLVKPSDTVICLGDICIGDDKAVHEKYIQQLPGFKILVKGNHDKKSDTWYESNGWQICCESMVINRYGHKVL